MGSPFKDCGCAKLTRCPTRFRDALGKQRDES
jgi:hypothetical protein